MANHGFSQFLKFLGKSGCQSHPPTPSCAGLVAQSKNSAVRRPSDEGCVDKDEDGDQELEIQRVDKLDDGGIRMFGEIDFGKDILQHLSGIFP